MKGIEREIDDVGRVVIPMEFRKALGVKFNSKVFISLSNDQIIITARDAICALCGQRVDNTRSLRLCNRCISRIKED